MSYASLNDQSPDNLLVNELNGGSIKAFGRIGRLAFRKMLENESLEVVAVNDLSAPSMLAYLLKL